MKRWRSIGGKLNRLVLLAVGVALCIATFLSLWHETNRYILLKREVLLATAEGFGAAASRAIASRDSAAVLQSIRGIARIPGLTFAEARDRDGEILAQIGGVVRLAGDLDLDETSPGSVLDVLTSTTVQISVPVIEGGDPVGRIVLIADTSDLFGRLTGVLLSAGLGSAIAVAVGLLLSFRLQRKITQPLTSLAEKMAVVERSRNYAAGHIDVVSDDETGVLASSFNSMIEEIRKATDEIIAREEEVIVRLSRAAEKRDDQTGEHIVRVAKLCWLIADALGLDPKWSHDLYRASPMHDIGKIGVRDSILFKPGRLDDEERLEMEMHAEFGFKILRDSNSELIQLAAEIALSHHERWDGAGYPRKLKEHHIPLSGRITAVADVCDALTSERPYKKAWPLDAVKAHLLENRGSHFDPACVDALVKRWSDVERVYSREREDSVIQAKAA